MNFTVITLILVVIFSLQNPAFGAEGLRCALLFTHQSVPRSLSINSSSNLAEAMTKGMILRPQHKGLFDLYKKDFFGNRFVKMGYSNFELSYTYLNQHPELQKRVFREYELTDHQSKDVIRVRSLSLQESPFRSCLGGDCASRSYFDLAFDPNFIYFTMTDSQFFSSGQATIVLGTGISPETGKSMKIAFLDKLQNVPNEKIKTFLLAISKSLAEEGYQLGIPDKVEEEGADTGISIYDKTTEFFKENIMPELKDSVRQFEPHKHSYNFPNKYSNAFSELDMKIFRPLTIDKDVVIRRGQLYEPFLAPLSLNSENWIRKEDLNVKEYKSADDLLKFIQLGDQISFIEASSLYSSEQFKNDLFQILKRKDILREIRVQAALRIILLVPPRELKSVLNPVVQLLSKTETIELANQIKLWEKSNNTKKKIYFRDLNVMLLGAVEENNLESVKLYLLLGADVFYNNGYDVTPLSVAIKNGHSAMIEFLQALMKAKSNFLLDNKS